MLVVAPVSRRVNPIPNRSRRGGFSAGFRSVSERQDGRSSRRAGRSKSPPLTLAEARGGARWPLARVRDTGQRGNWAELILRVRACDAPTPKNDQETAHVASGLLPVSIGTVDVERAYETVRH